MKAKTPRLLVVEDEGWYGPELCRIFEDPRERHRKAFGIDRFVVQLARTRAEAEAYLAEAAASFRPYDVLLLDLGLPESEGMPARREEGLRILPALDSRLGTQVAINSIYTDLNIINKTLDFGLYSFLLKRDSAKLEDDGEASVYQSVVDAYRQGELRRKSMWAEFQRERAEQWTLVHAYAMADGMSQIVTDGVAKLRQHGQSLADLLAERNGLRPEQDADDLVYRSVLQILEDADWISECLRARFQTDEGSLGDEAPREETLDELVHDSVWRCVSGIAYKGLSLAALPRGRHVARVYRHDLGKILDELISNAVEASGVGQGLAVEVDERAGPRGERTIEVCVRDEAPAIDARWGNAIALNQPLDADAGRAWGLSLARRVADKCGAWIDVVPGPSGAGNSVRLHIPVTSAPLL
jgi:signal transduction histidine kinase